MCEHNKPDSKIHWANMGSSWDRQDAGGPHVGPMDFAIWEPLKSESGHDAHFVYYNCDNKVRHVFFKVSSAIRVVSYNYINPGYFTLAAIDLKP